MLESVLMRAFLMLYVRDIDGDDDRCPRMSGKSMSSERRAFTVLSSVCWNWHLTLTGWPDSPTSQWVRHQLRKMILREYFVFSIITPALVVTATCTCTCFWHQMTYIIPCVVQCEILCGRADHESVRGRYVYLYMCHFQCTIYYFRQCICR